MKGEVDKRLRNLRRPGFRSQHGAETHSHRSIGKKWRRRQSVLSRRRNRP